MFSERAERRALFLVALQFFMLVPFIVYEAPGKLVSGGEIETSWLGMGLALATLAICQPLGFREAAPGRAAWVRRDCRGGYAGPPVRLPDRGAYRPSGAGPRTPWRLATRPGRLVRALGGQLNGFDNACHALVLDSFGGGRAAGDDPRMDRRKDTKGSALAAAQ
jgi:hypothetical protein